MRFFKLLVSAGLLLIGGSRAATAQGLNIDMSMKVDALGDGVMTTKFTMNAVQYQNWQTKYGQNQALLKRDMSKFVSQYDTRDWEIQDKSIDRNVTISVKMMGCVVNRGGGVFEFRVPKQWRGGDRMGSVYTFNYVEPMGHGEVSQTNVKLFLPETATRFAEDKSETGDRIIQYTLPAGIAGRMTLWLGLAALAAGALAVVASFRMS